MSAFRPPFARTVAALAISSLLAALAPAIAQDTTLPTDRPAETPPQSETAPPPEAPAARPDDPGVAPTADVPAPQAPADAPAAPDEAPETPAARPDAGADAPAAETPAAEAPADPPQSVTEPPAEGPVARPETADDPPPLPASLLGVPEPVLALHVSTTFCEDPSGPALADHAALVAPLGPTAVLAGIPCTGDAARAAFRLYVLETGEIGGVHAQFFALPSKTLGWTGTEALWQPSMDSDGRLTGTLYDPGEGRCASRGRWRWNGYALALETAEMEATCGKGDWRTLYP